MLRLVAFRLLGPVVGRWPGPWYVIAVAAGWAWWYLSPTVRRNTIRNQLPLCGGDQRAARKLARTAIVNVSRYYVDLATIPHRDLATFERDHVQFINEERLSVLAAPVPVIVLSAHLGNPELGVQALIGRGRRFVALVERLSPPAFAQEVAKLRGAAGGRYYVADVAGVRAALKELRANGTVALIGDRDIQESGVCVELCGRAVRLPKGPFELARRTNATILPMFANRVGREDMILHIEEPMVVGPGEGDDAGVTEAVRHFARLLEEHLLRDPGQWTVTEDFWSVHACG